MKTDIILAGVGGQGILTIAAAIGYAAIQEGLYIKQAEVHGMSQRGGAVQSNLRLSDRPIYSDLIPLGNADLILAVEPLESLRYLPYLSENGWLITNEQPFVNIDNYPDMTEVMREIKKIPNNMTINADQAAKKFNNPKSSNIVMLGMAAQFINLGKGNFIKGITQLFKNKGNIIVEQNQKAFLAGWDYAKSLQHN